MMSQDLTKGEELFEGYLLSQSLDNFEYEKCFPGKSKRPDYALRVGKREYLFEVKDFTYRPRPLTGTYDPYKRIRGKIDKAKVKFREYKDWPCCLVLHNNGAQLVFLNRPNVIFEAMYGDPAMSWEVDSKRGELLMNSERLVHLSGGRMLRPNSNESQNTTISAIVTLGYVSRSEDQESVLGVSVWENYLARIPFPRNLFRGPFDERYGVVCSQYTRIF